MRAVVLVLAAACGTAQGAKVPSVAGVECGRTGGECRAMKFPEFDRSCASDADCVIREHESQRYTSSTMIGINRADAARFDEAERACIAQMDAKGPMCASPVVHIITADDGQTVGSDPPRVACVSGACKTYIPP
jgi:hypothetical protein